VPSAWPVPIRLWAEVLASIIRMFPGIGPDSLCPDLAYVPAAGLETVFDATLSELSALLTRTRSLMLGEWQVNEEVRNVIRRQIAAAGASGGTSQGMGEAVHRRPPQSQAIPRPAPSANMTRTR